MFIKAQYQWESFNLWNGCLNKRCFQINANIYPSLSLSLSISLWTNHIFHARKDSRRFQIARVVPSTSATHRYFDKQTQHRFIMIIIFIIIVMIIMLSLFSGAKSDVCRLVVSKQIVCTASRNMSSFRFDSSVIPQLLSSQAGKPKGINKELCRVS